MFRYRAVRPLDHAVTRVYATLCRDGWRHEARPLLEEFFLLDKVCLLAELRALMLGLGYSVADVARHDR